MRSSDLCPSLRLDAEREVLAGARRGERLPVGVLEADRDDGVAFRLDRGDGQPAEAGPGGGRAGRDQAGVPAARLSVDQGLERRLPAGAERRDPQRAKQLLTRVAGEVEESADLGDGHLLRAGGDLDDFVARLHVALLEHAEVEAGTPV